MKQDALAAVFMRNEFYRRMHFFALLAFVLSVVVMGILLGILVYLIQNPTEPLYFVTDEVGRLIKEPPLTEPNMSPDEVVSWAVEAVEAAYSYDYIHFREQLHGD